MQCLGLGLRGGWLGFWFLGSRLGSRGWRELCRSFGKVNFFTRRGVAAEDIGDEERRVFEICHAQRGGLGAVGNGHVCLAGDDVGNRPGFNEDKIFRGIDHSDRAGHWGVVAAGGLVL